MDGRLLVWLKKVSLGSFAVSSAKDPETLGRAISIEENFVLFGP